MTTPTVRCLRCHGALDVIEHLTADGASSLLLDPAAHVCELATDLRAAEAALLERMAVAGRSSRLAAGWTS